MRQDAKLIELEKKVAKAIDLGVTSKLAALEAEARCSFAGTVSRCASPREPVGMMRCQRQHYTAVVFVGREWKRRLHARVWRMHMHTHAHAHSQCIAITNGHCVFRIRGARAGKYDFTKKACVCTSKIDLGPRCQDKMAQGCTMDMKTGPNDVSPDGKNVIKTFCNANIDGGVRLFGSSYQFFLQRKHRRRGASVW